MSWKNYLIPYRISKIEIMLDRRKEFFKEAFLYTLSAFGGPQAHLAMMLRQFVHKKKYITEQELMELNALAQFLPGPSSSQTLAGIAFKIGGLWYAIGIYLIWVIPSTLIMFFTAYNFWFLTKSIGKAPILHYIEYMAIGFVSYAAFSLIRKNVKTYFTIFLAIFSGLISIIINSAFIFPILIIVGGILGSFFGGDSEERELGTKLIVNINPIKLFYFLGIFAIFALIGAIVNRTSPFSLPIRLFQNFYRNGIFIYGGGQVLIPYLYTEMVEMKRYLNPQEFLFGFGIQQAIPGPVFSFSSFVGARAMGNSGYGIGGQLAGSFLAMVGINSPGLILMLFILPFWNSLKQITRIKNALTGVNAVSVGFILASIFLLIHQVPINGIGIGLIGITFLTLTFTKIPAPILIGFGLLLGFVFQG